MDTALLLDMYREMTRIRRFEEQIWQLYTSGLMQGLAHLYIGEEAVAVGVCAALRDDDCITSTHRGHGHCVAKGGRLDRMMAEVMGRETGYCKGRGGSMHIADLSLGILGANGIVGGGFGIAGGSALSAKLRGTDQVTVTFFGDGASNQGVFFEVMNMSAIWNLPLVFVCENNHYGEYTAADNVAAGKLADRSAPFGIPSIVVDGNDVAAVYEAAAAAVARARKKEGPTLIECDTYRYHGHHVGDPGVDYRGQAERDAWQAKDPIARLRQQMLAEGSATEAALDDVDAAVEKEVLAAVEAGKNAPFPDALEVGQYVYA